jgi:2'-5' RNA ligase
MKTGSSKKAVINGFNTRARDLGNTMPGYSVNEYLLVIPIPENGRERVMAVKQQFSEHYAGQASVFGKPQITLASFAQYQLIEERLLNRLGLISMAAPPVKISMKDYGSFPTHTIYINVTSKLPVQQLVKTIRTEAQQLMKLNNENKPHFILEPYIAIASRIQPSAYEKAWLEYSNSHFTASFIADAMLLLKRPFGETQYTIVRRFEFRNMPVSTEQGNLFGG